MFYIYRLCYINSVYIAASGHGWICALQPHAHDCLLSSTPCANIPRTAMPPAIVGANYRLLKGVCMCHTFMHQQPSEGPSEMWKSTEVMAR